MSNRRFNTQTRKAAMGGGMMRKMYSEGNGKPISKSKNKGLHKLVQKKPELAKKFGYDKDRIVAKTGGRAKFGSGSPKTITGMKPTLGLKKTEEYKKKLKEKNKGKK